ncbi:MAG: hypothetical protein CBC42_00915 [Betaproteobacteria bacterium TMED82]|nr:MAG: hypothetical protein CBC42_00915 [Betaproteobacteria bacterium TMED82]|tara:strand:- start:9815 stop:10054 length:240 start_codon:yes stop_codon:yes gene_type:complete
MNIEFKDIKTVGDLKKVLEKLELSDDSPIKLFYDYDLTSTEDTKLVRDTLAKSNGNLRYEIHEIRQSESDQLSIYLKFL